MSSDQFAGFVAANRQRLEAALRESLPVSAAPGTGRFNEALRHAVFPGGKRLRPHLTLVGAALGGASAAQALALACAVEFVHTSSLILDDLPAMDDAELRRDGPTLHVRFGEGVSILAAVALLNQSYALLAGAARAEPSRVENLPALIGEAAACVGGAGMVAGQAAELELSGASAAAPALASRGLKTTALMRLMMSAGALVAGAPRREVEALAVFGEALGRAYQIYDDWVDTQRDHGAGKSVGHDSRPRRPTEVEGLSEAEVRRLAGGVLERGTDALAPFGERAEARLLRSAVAHIFARFGAD